MPRPRKIKETPVQAEKPATGTNVKPTEETPLEPKKTAENAVVTYFDKFAPKNLATLLEKNAELAVWIGTIKAKTFAKGSKVKIECEDKFGNREEIVSICDNTVVDVVKMVVNAFNNKFPQDKQSSATNHVERKFDLYNKIND